ncbi:type II toxin-antitoxin system HicB family antitoxin [Pseudoprimorskyibacter insulae]|uniref:HicB family protein n=1 Tax=Pseudoprimorskyibacter insulae TaxID=1695997 RepID=A0A2R8AQF7_9RHOB|nr:type II toxin-antitoxin system HicB family antitoxin [Pseudoprimorskyibacter insulae]SPF78064.1 hypothetical protein PRI8871_00653 [Pseudoprimorskyibacter insulae]
MTQLKYKGYIGSTEVSVEDGVVWGKLLHIRDLVTYEAEKVEDLTAEFQSAVDDYLEDCKSDGREPDRPFKGAFNVRVGEDVHRRLQEEAQASGKTLNELVAQVLTRHTDFSSGLKRAEWAPIPMLYLMNKDKSGKFSVVENTLKGGSLFQSVYASRSSSYVEQYPPRKIQ